ncbi:MAG: AAA family ATPase [Ornithinimicrobium sp.]|jgi:predicted kinase|uniref:AAA family ATPase n=1 Tax=Ornithinimicrobium sp. TaxID=1977084 RepID=UPI003D9BC898
MTSRASLPAVHLLAGLNGAGKTTHARRLEATTPGVRFTLDEWMLRLHDLRFDDERYPALAEGCRELIWDMARQVLRGGTDVVMDWNHWSRDRRRQSREMAIAAGGVPLLHWVQVPIEVAIARSGQRNRASDEHAHRLDEPGIRHLASIFEEPGDDEDMPVLVVRL